MSQFIFLTKGFGTLIDDEDYEEISQYKWHVVEGKSVNYAARSGKDETGKPIHILLHRQLMNPPKGMVVDHINGDGLDNRRVNLRVVTHGENIKNSHQRRDFVYKYGYLFASDEEAENSFSNARPPKKPKLSAALRDDLYFKKRELKKQGRDVSKMTQEEILKITFLELGITTFPQR